MGHRVSSRRIRLSILLGPIILETFNDRSSEMSVFQPVLLTLLLVLGLVWQSAYNLLQNTTFPAGFKVLVFCKSLTQQILINQLPFSPIPFTFSATNHSEKCYLFNSFIEKLFLEHPDTFLPGQSYLVEQLQLVATVKIKI